MPTTTTRRNENTASTPILYLAFELSLDKWKLAFATELGGKIRMRTIPARDLGALEKEVAMAEQAFKLPKLGPVVSCYEAGRDGFWLHRHLGRLGPDRAKRHELADLVERGRLLFSEVPHQNGQEDHDRGISKAGNRAIRGLYVELAWRWLRLQPRSELTRWYNRRFAKGGPRLRKIGIVGLARKLLIAMWHFVEHGVVPEGAELKAIAP